MRSATEKSRSVIVWMACALVAMGHVRAAQLAQEHPSSLTKAISGQSLQGALEAFARDTGYQIVYRPDLVNAVKSGGATAGRSISDALHQLLQGTGLDFDFINDDAVAIIKARRSARAARNKATATPVTALEGLEGNSGPLQEVIVTATRREEDIQKVPISVTAVTQEQVEVLGARQMTDIVRFTPGLNVTMNQGAGNSISIRGIASTVGAATTGIYIDDTPIQARNNGYAPGSAFPSLFDLQRIEVLRGPQGTLFGAGSEGGTVRFVLAQPSLTQYSEYARVEGLAIQNGGIGGEIGAEINGPIVDERLGFLASVYYRKQPGYIDAATGTFTIVDPTGKLHGDSIDFMQTGEYYPNANWYQIKGYRFALKFAPIQTLQITPSIVYQDTRYNQADNSFLLAASNITAGQFNYLATPAGNPATNPQLSPSYGPNLEHEAERFILPALTVQWDFGRAQMIYNGSFFDRDQYAYRDYTLLYEDLYAVSAAPRLGDHSNGFLPDRQENLVQELRFQSTDTTGRFTWVAGGFYGRNRQYTNDIIGSNFLAGLNPLHYSNPNAVGLINGPPFGPGSTGFANYFGYPLLEPGSILFTDAFNDHETQLAAFFEDNFKITPKLTLTTGLRFSDFVYSLSSGYGGGENNVFPTYGKSCTELGYSDCSDNLATGVVPPPVFAATNVSTRYTATTPRASIQYQINSNDMVYTTVAKGFRPGGGGVLVPVASCAADLTQVGYRPIGVQTTQPVTFKPDYVWSYEVGTKSRVGPVLIDASAYDIRWSNIQTSVVLPDCAYSITINAGHVDSKGAELTLQAQALQMASSNLLLGGNWSYNKALFADDDVTPSGTILFHGDTGVPGAGPPIKLSVTGDYNLFLGGRNFYAHVDWAHSSAERRSGPTSPLSANYIAIDLTNGAYSQSNARLGARLLNETFDVSLFVNNLTNATPLLNAAYSYYRYYWHSTTLQPRTFGLTFVYRH